MAFAQRRAERRLDEEMTLFYLAVASGVNGGNSLKTQLRRMKRWR